MAGQALGGIFPALVNIVVIALDVQPPGSIIINFTEQTDPCFSEQGFYCFLVAFLFVLLSLVAFLFVQTTSFFQHHAGAGRDEVTSAIPLRLASYTSILAKCWRYLLSVFLVFSTSLAVFPSVTVRTAFTEGYMW